MTISLAIDTATSRTIVGVIENGKVLFEAIHEGATEHGFAITELVTKALEICPKPDRVKLCADYYARSLKVRK